MMRALGGKTPLQLGSGVLRRNPEGLGGGILAD